MGKYFLKDITSKALISNLNGWKIRGVHAYMYALTTSATFHFLLRTDDTEVKFDTNSMLATIFLRGYLPPFQSSWDLTPSNILLWKLKLSGILAASGKFVYNKL